MTKPKPPGESAPREQNLKSPWQPGQSGNPAGRPKGSRNKLGEAFVEALHDDFLDHGASVIAAVREADPSTYLRVVAGLLPREFKIENVDDLTDEQLDARIRVIASALGLEIGNGRPAGGEAEKAQPQPTPLVSSVH